MNLTTKANKKTFLFEFKPIMCAPKANNKLKMFYSYNILKIYNLEKKIKNYFSLDFYIIHWCQFL